jgi:hypothetical protein
MRATARRLRLRCAQCGRTGGEERFVPAVNPERRAVLGQIYSDLECPRCGDLAYPVTASMEPAHAATVVVLHEHGAQRSVYLAHSESIVVGTLEPAAAKRVARRLGINLAATPGGRLSVLEVASERVPTLRL